MEILCPGFSQYRDVGNTARTSSLGSLSQTIRLARSPSSESIITYSNYAHNFQNDFGVINLANAVVDIPVRPFSDVAYKQIVWKPQSVLFCR